MAIPDNDQSLAIQQIVKDAIDKKEPLAIVGGNTKTFYGFTVDGKQLSMGEHTGVISYEPTELCITVRAGTKLTDIESLLDKNNQILPFEPPQFGQESTIGGVIAAGISGPRRPYSGSIRDAILGVKIINGDSEIVTFGGQVMKNVAGYDLSRLMVRSHGTLGILLEVSIRLLPKPANNITIALAAEKDYALKYFRQSQTQRLPITASCWFDETLYLRFSGSEKSCDAAVNTVDQYERLDTEDFWQDIRNHRHHFFGRTDKPLWRLSLPPVSSQIARIDDNQLIEWGGAQRWVNSNAPANIIQNIAESRGGYATLFRGDLPETPNFSSLDEGIMQLHKQIKHKMDPHGIFNPGRIYSSL